MATTLRRGCDQPADSPFVCGKSSVSRQDLSDPPSAVTEVGLEGNYIDSKVNAEVGTVCAVITHLCRRWGAVDP